MQKILLLLMSAKKPLMVLDYNRSKGGVDMFDES